MSLTAKITGILAPTDFSRSAEEACRLAARLASRFDARLLMFHAIQTIDMALQIERTEGRTREEILNAKTAMQLFAPRDDEQHWARAIAMMRHGFGGHPYGPDEAIARERREAGVGDFVREGSSEAEKW